MVTPAPAPNATPATLAAASSTATRMPGARTLQDFEPLLLAELVVLRAAVAGNIAKVSYRRPRSPTPDVRLRADFLGFLARGGGDGAAVRGRRLQILGACIVGRLDLADANVAMSLWFFRCTFGLAPVFDGAHIRGSLSFGDSSLPGLRADACRVDGEFAFNSGSSIEGAVVLARARIGGDLLATGSRVSAELDPDGARGVAIDMTRTRVGGSVHLDGSFSAAGQVRLQQAHIDGDVDCTGAAFDAVGDASWGEHGAALLLDRARIGGALILRGLQVPLQSASLADARALDLVDDASTWGQHHVLDGFRYTRFGADAPLDAATRLDWLSRQHAPHTAADFRPDPWKRAIKVLRGMGRDRHASDLAIGMEWHLRRERRIGADAPAALRPLLRVGHALFGAFTGFGHRPLRLLAIMAAAWLLCGGVYWAAADEGRFAPDAALSVADPRLASCRPDCAPWPIGAPQFQPFVYSLDVFVPLLDLQQRRHWTPVDTGAPLLHALTWLEALCGWVTSLTLVAMITGLARRELDPR